MDYPRQMKEGRLFMNSVDRLAPVDWIYSSHVDVEIRDLQYEGPIEHEYCMNANSEVYWEPNRKNISVVKEERDTLLWTRSPPDRVVQAVAKETWAYQQRNTLR